MAKRQRRIEEDVAAVFEHWAISDKAKEELARRYSEEEEPDQEDAGEEPQGSASAEGAETADVDSGRKSSRRRPSKIEGQKQTLKNRPSKTDPQKLRVKNRGSKIASQGRVFSNRPSTTAEEPPSDLREDIPKRHFFSYYNALHDEVLPRVPKKSRLLLCALFRRSHGFNRNWCQASFPHLQRATGATTNTIRDSLRQLIEGGWVGIAADSYHEATTYILRIPVEIKDEGEERREDLDIVFDPQKLRVKNRGSKIEGQKLPERPSNLDPQKLTPCTSSTSTGHLKTGQEPDYHPSEIHRTPVRSDSPEATGENRVEGNLALQNSPQAQTGLAVLSQASDRNYLSEEEEAYIQTRSSPEQTEIFDAQDAWDEIIDGESRPSAPKLNEMLGHLRELGYTGESLDGRFRQCLEQTRGRARDPVAWMISALRNGRYP